MHLCFPCSYDNSPLATSSQNGDAEVSEMTGSDHSNLEPKMILKHCGCSDEKTGFLCYEVFEDDCSDKCPSPTNMFDTNPHMAPEREEKIQNNNSVTQK